MKIKLTALIIISIMMIIAIFSLVSAEEARVCCEKTTYGAWCQNEKASKCDSAYRKTPTSCDATSYCKAGCCYDSVEGTCSENTPQLVCQIGGGMWADSAKCDIPQCRLGCCILDNQAAYVSLVRCKKLAGFYGLQTNFRSEIRSESECIAVAQARDRGACVYEQEFVRTCKFTTRGECDAMKGKKTASNISFYKDYLCSAEELGTNCGPTKKTSCIEGKDEVYFVDSCGNPANIYDASRADDKAYWKKIIRKAESCGAGAALGNANSASCGNCDYFSGSFCRQYDKSKDKTRPTFGDYSCRDLNCKNTQDGKDYRHGESWCVYDNGIGNGKDPAGSRYWKHVCIAGEEIVEPCADFRQEICIQDKITTDKGDFQQAGCVVNKWRDCVSQDNEGDCMNKDRRDCNWIVNRCVPNYPPGLKFWSDEAAGICSIGNAQCTIEYEKGIIGKEGLMKEKCERNCECEKASWIQQQEQVCRALGDCTGSEGVYKYLQKGGFGVSGTKIIAVFSDTFGLKNVNAQEDKSINKGLVEGMKEKN